MVERSNDFAHTWPALRRARTAAGVLMTATLLAGCSSGWGPFKRDADVSAIETASVPTTQITRGAAAWNGDISSPGLTATHRSMAPGAWARVTNVKTGQSAAVRVTGPLDKRRGHDIELSRDAASAVGVLHEGVVEVLIEPIDPRAASAQERLWEPAPAVESAGGPAVRTPRAPLTAARAPRAPEGAIAYDPDRVSTSSLPRAATRPAFAGAGDSARYLQLGAFRNEGNARRLLGRLERQGLASGVFGDGFIETAYVSGAPFHRVRIGPLESEAEAQRALRDARRNGHNDARILRP
ncbi:MAG: SPOR domain-containing protein [Pseudomonadota bacterium]